MSTLDDLIEKALAQANRVSPSRAAEMISAGSVVCLDIREGDEIREGTVAGAAHAPRSNLEWFLDPASSSYVKALATRKPVLLACGSGKRCALSLGVLREFGYDPIVLEGGFTAWKAAGLPITRAPQAADAKLQRLDQGPRMSQASSFGGVVYLAGQVADNANGMSTAEQARQVLAKIDELLARAGSCKSNILQVTIWLTDMGDYQSFNEVWDAWIDRSQPPSRACIQASLAKPEWKVELMLTAACSP